MPRHQHTQSRVVVGDAARTPAPEAQFAPGDTVGNYRIEGVLGRGGMAIVYAAVHRVLARRVALKVMRDADLGAEARERVLREACILADLRHPAIVDVYDADVLADGRAWLAMAQVHGVTLSARQHGRRTLPPDEVAAMVAHLASALALAHGAGVVHRDLKPENIFLVDDAACPVRLIDWGIAQAASAQTPRLTMEGSTTGTPFYMAPEQARGLVVDGRCDVYALGVVAYEALAGVPPFATGSAVEVLAQHLLVPPPPLAARAPEAPPWLTSLIMAMLTKAPAARPTMDEVASTVRILHEPAERIIELSADLPEDDDDRALDELLAELPPFDDTPTTPHSAASRG